MGGCLPGTEGVHRSALSCSDDLLNVECGLAAICWLGPAVTHCRIVGHSTRCVCCCYGGGVDRRESFLHGGRSCCRYTGHPEKFNVANELLCVRYLPYREISAHRGRRRAQQVGACMSGHGIGGLQDDYYSHHKLERRTCEDHQCCRILQTRKGTAGYQTRWVELSRSQYR